MIEFESVGKTFRDGTAAVVDLSLVVPTGTVTVLVGPAGCGGTTALQMVNRLVEPTSGRILWDGSPLRSRRRTALRRQIGYVAQGGGLFPHRTVVDNIGTVPSLLGWTRSKTRRRALELLDSVGLERGLADRYPAQLGEGQQQRVALARALAADPPVVLMDEPFAAADPAVRRELHTSFLDLQRSTARTVLLVTHDVDEAVALGDQVAVLQADGHLAQVGSPQELLEHPADSFVAGFVGRDRGYRALSFAPASALDLGSVPVVRDAGSAAADRPTLVVDADARPVGWVEPAGPGEVRPLGATFEVESGTLRSALDAALTSPYGLAVGVSAAGGRYAGVATADAILAAVAQARREHRPEPVPVREPAEPQEQQAAGGAHPLTAVPLPDALDDAEDDAEDDGHRADPPGDGHAYAELGDESGQHVDLDVLRPGDETPDPLGADDETAIRETERAGVGR